MKMNGYENEFNFVKEINNKKVSEINEIFKELIYDLFIDIKDDYIIKAWKNHYDQKTDILIKINDKIKRLSIKMGYNNSVHVEKLNVFVEFLKENYIPGHIIKKLLKYHYADGTTNNTGLNRLSSEEYKTNNQAEIDEINSYFCDPQLIIKIINRFLLKGLVYNDNVDAIVYGTPNDFLWINQVDIYTIILSKIRNYSTSIHFGPLVYQPLNRCLNGNPKYEYGREYIQIKWYSLFDDIIHIKNIKTYLLADMI